MPYETEVRILYGSSYDLICAEYFIGSFRAERSEDLYEIVPVVYDKNIAVLSGSNRTGFIIDADAFGRISGSCKNRCGFGNAEFHGFFHAAEKIGCRSGYGSVGKSCKPVFHIYSLSSKLVFSVRHSCSHHRIADQTYPFFSEHFKGCPEVLPVPGPPVIIKKFLRILSNIARLCSSL